MVLVAWGQRRFYPAIASQGLDCREIGKVEASTLVSGLRVYQALAPVPPKRTG
jgi:hypothetical protein